MTPMSADRVRRLMEACESGDERDADDVWDLCESHEALRAEVERLTNALALAEDSAAHEAAIADERARVVAFLRRDHRRWPEQDQYSFEEAADDIAAGAHTEADDD